MNFLQRIMWTFAFATGFMSTSPCAAVTFTTGDFITYNHDDWGDASGNAGHLLADHFADVYASTGQVLEVGIPGSSGFSIQFTDPSFISVYLPDNGQPGVLDADYGNPGFTSSGQFGSLLVGLKLNIDYSDAGFLPSSQGTRFGDLVIGSDTSGLPSLGSADTISSQFYGLTIRQFLELSESVLGGALPYSYDYVQTAYLLNTSFLEDQTVSETAQRQLSYPELNPADGGGSGVPETATWVLMVFGFGAMGQGLRRIRGSQLGITASA